MGIDLVISELMEDLDFGDLDVGVELLRMEDEGSVDKLRLLVESGMMSEEEGEEEVLGRLFEEMLI